MKINKGDHLYGPNYILLDKLEKFEMNTYYLNPFQYNYYLLDGEGKYSKETCVL